MGSAIRPLAVGSLIMSDILLNTSENKVYGNYLPLKRTKIVF